MYAKIHIWYLQLWQFEYIAIRLFKCCESFNYEVYLPLQAVKTIQKSHARQYNKRQINESRCTTVKKLTSAT